MFTSFALTALLITTLPTGPLGDLPARPGATVSLPQSLIEADDGFVMLGDRLAASLETGRMRWMLTDAQAVRSVITIEPVDARAGVAPVGEDLLPGIVNHFHGSASEWRTGQRTFRSVRYADLWAGIDLLLEARGDTLKGTYVVAPGADPCAIRMRHHGADSVRIDAAGRLIVATPAGQLVDAAPVAWQQIGGERREISVAFELDPADDGAVDASFKLGEHDPTVELLIDPAVIVQAGFLGGASNDYVTGVAVDEDGFVYVVGWTLSDEATFPVVVGPELVWQGAASPTQGDAFVAKLDPTGTTLIYAGFLGGFEFDFGRCLAVDRLGRAYIGGHTGSSVAQGFPAVAGPDTSLNSSTDGWVARVSADGTALEFCGYVGGNGEDRVFGIDVDDVFQTYIVGRFESLPATLPLTVGPDLTPPGGPTDSFIARLSPDGLTYHYCGYIGGSSFDDITFVKADSVGGALFTGWTGSADFPLVGALGGTYLAAADTVVGRVDSDGSALTWSGYLSSNSTDVPGSLVVDGSGAAYVAGITLDSANFPVVVGPELVPSGTTEGFVTKIAADGQSIEWSGFTGTGYSAVLALDAAANAWVLTAEDAAGGTTSQPVLARIPPGGAGYDMFETIGPPGLALGHLARVPEPLTPGAIEFWMAGTTELDESVVPVVSGPDLTANGGFDVVLMQVRFANGPWSDEGCALAGALGDPTLVGSGDLSAGSNNAIDLSNALPSSPMGIFVALSSTPTPFKGGTLKPVPWIDLLLATTSVGGGLSLPFVMPAGVPSSTELWLQAAIQDATAVASVALSNAVLGTTP